MSTAQARNRYISQQDFLRVWNDQGWWYRVLKLNYKPWKTATDFDPDDLMPHLGTLFGLTQDATSIILVEMGFLLERKKGTTTITCQQGWDDLAKEFKVKYRAL
jgi:hypothetical protein